MQFIKSYWKRLVKSASEPAFYKSTVLIEPLSIAIRFFLFTVFLLSIVMVAHFRVREIPELKTMIQTELTSMEQQFPKDAAVVIDQGKLETQGLPPNFTMHSTNALSDKGFPKNLVTITEQPANSTSFLTATKEELLILSPESQNRNEQSTFAYGDLFTSRTEINKQTFQTWISLVAAKFDSLATILAILGTPFIWLSITISSLFTTLLFSLAFQSLAWLFGVRLQYKAALKIGLYCMTMALIIEEITRIFIGSIHFSFLSVAFFGMISIILWELKRTA